MRELLLVIFFVIHCGKTVAQLRKSYEDFIDFGKIKDHDSIVISNRSGKRELVVRYRNSRLDKILYLDTLSSKPLAWKSYHYYYDGRLKGVEHRECWGIEDPVKKTKIACANVYTFYIKEYSYDSSGRVANEKFVHYYLGQKDDSVIYQFQYLKHRIVAQGIGERSRKIVKNFDDLDRIVSKTEVNSQGEIFYELAINYKNTKNALIVLKVFRDTLDDIAFPQREFNYELRFNNKDLPVSFIDESKRAHYFEYF